MIPLSPIFLHLRRRRSKDPVKGKREGISFVVEQNDSVVETVEFNDLRHGGVGERRTDAAENPDVPWESAKECSGI